MYYKAKSKNRRQGRVEFTSLNGFMDLIFAISSPAQILGRSHFTQVSVASSKMRRFIRRMKGGVTIHVSPTAVQAPLRDPSQLCISVQPPSSSCACPTLRAPCSNTGAGRPRFVPTPASEFCPGLALSAVAVHSLLKSKIHLKSALERGKKLFTPLPLFLQMSFYIFILHEHPAELLFRHSERRWQFQGAGQLLLPYKWNCCRSPSGGESARNG